MSVIHTLNFVYVYNIMSVKKNANIFFYSSHKYHHVMVIALTFVE